MESKKCITVVAAIFIRGGLFFAAQRGPSMSLAGCWEFPGGKIEPGETPQEALARELREELHVEARVGEHVETTVHQYDFGVVELSTYRCEMISGEPTLTEHSEMRWVPVADLLELNWAPADIPAVEKLAREASAK